MLEASEPLYPYFGEQRGNPIGRHYIERFLEAHAEDERGEELEAGAGPDYTRRSGGNRVTCAHKMYPAPGFAGATLVGDPETGDGIPESGFDAAILTQVFQCI